MYVNKCIKCGAEFETKNPKRVICPNCLYADKGDSTEEKPMQSYSSYSTEQKPRSYDRPQQGGYRNNYGRDGQRDNRGGGYQRRDNGGNYNRGGFQRRPDGQRDNRGGFRNNYASGGRNNGGFQRRPNPAKRPRLQKQAKILLPDMSGNSYIFVDDGEFYPLHNIYYITGDSNIKLYILAAILMSDFAKNQLAAITNKMNGGFLRWQSQYLKKIL